MSNHIVIKTKMYPVSRFSSVEVETRYCADKVQGRAFRVFNEVTGMVGDYVYATYDAAKQGAREIGDHYYHTERRSGY